MTYLNKESMMEVSQSFILQEFVNEDIYNRLGNNAIWVLDPKIIKVAQKIRYHFDSPMYINTWVFRGKGKRLQWRGFRPSLYTKCAYFSQHKMGRAIDFSIDGVTPEEVQEELKKVQKSIGFSAMEVGTPTWTHVDIRNQMTNKPLYINHKVSKAIKVV